MDTDLRTQVLHYLETHHTLTVATTGPDGPWAAALFYVNDGLVLYWLSDPQARHSRNIAIQPRVAITIHEDYRDWQRIQGLQMEGTAALVGRLADAKEPTQRYAAKYPFLGDWRSLPAALARALEVVRVYRFTPARVLFIDNTRGFGHREELWPLD